MVTVQIENYKLKSNIYDQRSIINANIRRIVRFQNSKEYINITAKNRIHICKLLEKQRKYQRSVNTLINEREQQAFNFGL